jgi:DNA repair protein RadC
LLSAKKSDLSRIKGLGPAKIAQLVAAIEIVKRQIKEKVRDRKEEFFKVVFLNKSNMILGIEELARGTVDEASIYPREVIRTAISMGATAVIFVHNHPSGNLKPSQKDIDVTNKLKAACQSVDIAPLDHIIISPHGHISLKGEKLL